MPGKLNSSPVKGNAAKTSPNATPTLHSHGHTESVVNTPRAKTQQSPDLTTPIVRQDHNALAGFAPAQNPNEDSKGSWRSWTRGEGLQNNELDLAQTPEVRRKANVCQLCKCSAADAIVDPSKAFL